MTAIRVRWTAGLLAYQIDIPPQPGSPYRYGQLHAPDQQDALAVAALVSTQLQIPTAIWDDTTGGYVCAHPDPDHPDCYCGRPVETGPCPQHTPPPPPPTGVDDQPTIMIPRIEAQ